MPRDGGGPTNGRSLTYEALVKSLFTNISHGAKEPPDVPPRPQSRMGFRRKKSSRTKNRPQQNRPLHHVPQTAASATSRPGASADSDEDTADSDTSDEWSTDSDTSDTTDLRPYSAIPLNSSPILVPDAFPDQDLPNLAIQTDLPVHPPSGLRSMLPHHGLSRSALQHQKWLWNTRYDEWMQWRAEVETAEAEMGPYGGISNAAAIEPPPLRRSRIPSPMPPEAEHSPMGSKKAELNEKIFPRTGDIMALHDPHVARQDQTFCNYPLCTIQKVLFVCSMDTAARERSPLSRDSGIVNHHGDIQDTDTSPSTTKGVGGEERALAPHGPPTSESAFPLLTKLSWEQSWHTRWEVLTALVKMTEQNVLAQCPTTIPSTVTTPIGLPVVARNLADVNVDESSNTRVERRFFFASAEEAEVNDGCESDDDDDDEEDDYGEIVLNPRFALQRTMTDERVLGRPFLHAQMLPVHRQNGIKVFRS